MAMLEKTIQAVKDLDNTINAAKNEFQNAQKTILETYKEPAATEKLTEARDVRTEIEVRETQAAKAIVVEDFAKVREMVGETVTQAVPADFVATLEALKAKGDKITEYEAASFLKKYSGNYTAYSAILNLLHQSGKGGDMHLVTPDMMDERITFWENKILTWMQGRAGIAGESDYMSRLLTTSKGNPIQALADEVEAFCNGSFVMDIAGKLN